MIALEKMRFFHIYRKLIHACLQSMSFSALVEGSSTETFHASRGVRQGDPFSPFMFIAMLEMFNRRLKEDVIIGQLELYK